MSYENFLNVATEAAYLAGEYIRRRYGQAKQIEFKGEIDLVTEVDLASEKIIVDKIRTSFPDHQILAEEGGWQESASEYTWIIDPIDGTTNFAHSFPYFCVSIGLLHENEIIVGVVNDPMRNELFFATRNGGAFLNNQPIVVSKISFLLKSLLATGFPYNVRTTGDDNIVHFRDFLLSSQAVRRPGSAALDLCYVACGRFDGFWEKGLHPWDMAAGVLLVREAGGQVSSYDGEKFDLFSPEILASNGQIHNEMIAILQNPSV